MIDFVVARGRKAWRLLQSARTKKSSRFDHWISVGFALATGRAIVLQGHGLTTPPPGGRWTRLFHPWLEENGFSEIPRPVRSRLAWVIDHLDEVRSFRNNLPAHLRGKINHPDTLYRYRAKLPKADARQRLAVPKVPQAVPPAEAGAAQPELRTVAPICGWQPPSATAQVGEANTPRALEMRPINRVTIAKPITTIGGNCLAEIPKLVQQGYLYDAMVSDLPYNLTMAKVYSGRRVLNDHAVGQLQSHPNTASGGSARLCRGFMGNAWDSDIAFHPETWEILASGLRPGGYIAAFGSPRTHHRMWCAIESAGLQIQDTICWLYSTGFPKQDSQLKPAWEPIVLAFKPGGKRTLNIDECRVPLPENDPLQHGIYGRDGQPLDPQGKWGFRSVDRPPGLGRWPANLAHDGSEEVLDVFAQFGTSTSRGSGKRGSRQSYGATWAPSESPDYNDSGTAARFFYCGKATAADKAGSQHPTVKPVALVTWLVRLVTPPGGLVLDPFAGSGTTGAAALAAGRSAILIEKQPQYIADIERRFAA